MGLRPLRVADMHGALAVLFAALVLTPLELSGETETRSAAVGETVRLRCEVAHEKKTLWFGQRPDEVPFLSLSVSRMSYEAHLLFMEFVLGDSPRLEAEFDAAADSVLLKIGNVTERDVALYYCASMRKGGLHFGNGTKIVLSGDELSRPPSLAPPECVFCCVHLAFVSLLCAVVCTMGLCCCVRQILNKISQEEGELPVASRIKTRSCRSET